MDVTKYLGDHPGGPEIMLEFAGCLYSNWKLNSSTVQFYDLFLCDEGKNADDMFEDIGHSSEARQRLKEYIIGKLKVSSK